MILDSQYEDCQRAEDGCFSVLNGPLRYVKFLLLKIYLKLQQSNNLHNYLVKKSISYFRLTLPYYVHCAGLFKTCRSSF